MEQKNASSGAEFLHEAISYAASLRGVERRSFEKYSTQKVKIPDGVRFIFSGSITTNFNKLFSRRGFGAFLVLFECWKKLTLGLHETDVSFCGVVIYKTNREQAS